MNSDWQQFLKQQQAHIEDEHVRDFGDADGERRAAATQTVMADLSHQGLISAHGSDTETFLQGQFTNDVARVTPQQSELAAYCSPKGRILASMRLFRRGDRTLLSLPRGVLEPTLKRLRMFVLRSDVTLEDASDELARMGLAGPDAASLLEQHLPLPAEPDQVSQQDELTVIRLPGPADRFEIHGPAAALQSLWGQLAEQARPVGYPAWSWLDIVAGLPTILPDTTDAFVPQMVNLHSLNGISFTKGCYTGQEVVARMHYLGKLKRRMYRAHLDIDTPPAPGEPLYAHDASAESSAGKVVIAQPAPEGGVDLLAVLQIANVEAGSIHLGAPDGPQLQFQELPYSVAIEA